MDSYRQRPSNFLLVRSEHAHASYPGLFFSKRRVQDNLHAHARVQPLYGAGSKESPGTGLIETKLVAFTHVQLLSKRNSPFSHVAPLDWIYLHLFVYLLFPILSFNLLVYEYAVRGKRS